MVTRRIVLSLLAFAPALALGTGTAQAFNPQPEPPGKEVLFQDGTRAFIDRTGRVFVFRLAKDGTYRTKNGETITVVNGSIPKRGAPLGAVPPKDPTKAQQGAVGAGR